MTNRTLLCLLLALMVPAAIAGCPSYEIVETCPEEPCASGLECCNGECIDTRFDPFHCGSCDDACTADARVCTDGVCGHEVNCPSDGACKEGETCCGDQCCGSGQVCCGVLAVEYKCVDMNKLVCPSL